MVKIILRGIGQVMFQNNIYSGLLFLVGIFYNSWLLGIAALLGTIVSTFTAQILKYPKDDIMNGLFGFNGTLTGIAVLCFFELNWITFLMLILGSGLSSYVMFLLKKLLPPFTAPFVLVTWLAIYTLLFAFNLPLLPSAAQLSDELNIISSISNSFGQVMFNENVITGLFFLLAIFINNKLMALYALYAALLGSFSGWLILTDHTEAINSGLMGYNAILCAIALTGNKWSDFLWITIAIIFSTIINIGIGTMGIITLTAPFVLSTWIILKFKNIKN